MGYMAVTIGRTCEENGDRLPALAHVLRGGEDEDLERGVEGIDAVVEELPKRTGLLRTSSKPHLISLAFSHHTPEVTYAWDPSTASKVWYRNRPTAQL